MPASSDTASDSGAAGPLSRSPGKTWRRSFRGDPRELAALRRWLTCVLPDRPARSDLLTVATELGTNAIRHTASGQDGWFTAEITMLGSVVRVMVADQGGLGEPRVITDPDGETGRGLLLVTGLSERTGVTGDRNGRQVWAEITWDHPGGMPADAATPAGSGQAEEPLPTGQPLG